MRYIVIALVILLCNGAHTNAQKLDDFARGGIENLQKWYNPETGLWITTGWWNSANVLTEIIRYMEVCNDKDYNWVIDYTFEKTKLVKGTNHEGSVAWVTENYINDYYDDEGWWALAWIKAYDFTGEKKYLDMAEVIFSDMAKGWSANCGGGIYWKKNAPYKAAISNELFFLTAVRLALRVEKKHDFYKQWADKEWNWIKGCGLIQESGLVIDGIGEDCTPQGLYFTYNQGVILAALCDYAELTGDNSFIGMAQDIACAAMKNMSDSKGILVGFEKPEGGADGAQFKGIFMRHAAYLYLKSKNKDLRKYILDNAGAIIRNTKQNKSALIGPNWGTMKGSADAASHSSGLGAIVSAICVK